MPKPKTKKPDSSFFPEEEEDFQSAWSAHAGRREVFIVRARMLMVEATEQFRRRDDHKAAYLRTLADKLLARAEQEGDMVQLFIDEYARRSKEPDKS